MLNFFIRGLPLLCNLHRQSDPFFVIKLPFHEAIRSAHRNPISLHSKTQASAYNTLPFCQEPIITLPKHNCAISPFSKHRSFTLMSCSCKFRTCLLPTCSTNCNRVIYPFFPNPESIIRNPKSLPFLAARPGAPPPSRAAHQSPNSPRCPSKQTVRLAAESQQNASRSARSPVQGLRA